MKKLVIILVLMYVHVELTRAQEGKRIQLNETINTKYEEINPLLSPDEKTLYFTRCNDPRNKFGNDSEEIWYSKLDAMGQWSEAKPLTELNITRYNALMGITEDGKTVLLKNKFNRKGTQFKSRGLSISTHDGKKWGTPVPLRIKGYKDKGRHSTGYMTLDGNTILISYSEDRNDPTTDIYVIEKGEGKKWKSPIPLTSINTETANEDAPFLSSDGKTLYFSSNRELGNRYNIYSTHRLGEGWDEWSEPELLSSTVNAKWWESYYKTSKDGKIDYWSTTGSSSGGYSDIVMIREEDLIVLTGKFINTLTDKPFPPTKFRPGDDFKLLIGGEPVNSLQIDSLEGVYRAHIPNDTTRLITIQSPRYKSSAIHIDPKKVVGGKEYVDFELTPDPYIVIYGRIMEYNSREPVQLTSLQPKFMVNQKSYDSIQINLEESTYEMRLPYGQVYDLAIHHEPYNPLPRKIDLTRVYDYERRNIDMYVTSKEVTVVQGKIVDTNTKKPVSGTSVYVEDQSFISSDSDPVTGDYSLSLPKGETYTINTKTKGYIGDPKTVDVTNSEDSLIQENFPVAQLEVGQVISLNHIYFDQGNSILVPKSFQELNRMVRLFNENETLHVEIGGHTDDVGSVTHNLDLSQRRAQAVANYMIGHGVSTDRLEVRGYGKTRPLASNETEEGRSKNRRVEFIVLEF